MVPTHGSSLKPPPDTTPDDAGDSSASSFAWMVRASKIRQRLRAHICAGSGRTPGATPKSNVDTTRGTDAGFRKPASFCAPTCISRSSRGGERRRTSSPATRQAASPPTSLSCRGSSRRWPRSGKGVSKVRFSARVRFGFISTQISRRPRGSGGALSEVAMKTPLSIVLAAVVLVAAASRQS